MMKYVFVLVLLVVGGAGGALGLNVVYRWTHNMFVTQQRDAGRDGLHHASGQRGPDRERAGVREGSAGSGGARKNPVPSTPESIAKGSALFVIYCTPCHGASGKGDGLVAAKFVPPAGPHQRGPAEVADRRLLAELPERGRRGHALLRGGSLA